MKVYRQGDLIAVRGMEQKSAQDRALPVIKRGGVTSFSNSSRRRLLRIAGALDASKPALFVTLTLPKGSSHGDLRQGYNRFREAMRRAYPHAAWLWRKELHKSGTPHMHLLIYNLPFLPASWLWDLWQRVTNGRHRVDIRRLTDPRAALRYVSKYLAKVEKTDAVPSLVGVPYLHGDQKESSGRWWGIHNRKELPFAECVEIENPSVDLVRYLTWYVQRCLFRRQGTWAGNFTALCRDAASIIGFIARVEDRIPLVAAEPLIC